MLYKGFDPDLNCYITIFYDKYVKSPTRYASVGGLYMSVMAQEMRHQKKLENVMLLSLIPGDVDFTHVWENFRLEIKELQVRKFCCLLNPFLFCSFFFLLLFLRQKVSRFDTQSAENNSLTESNWGCSRRTALKGRGIWTMSVLRPGSAVPDAMPPRFLLSSLSSRKQFLILSCLLSSFFFLLPPPPPPSSSSSSSFFFVAFCRMTSGTNTSIAVQIIIEKEC